MKMKKIISILLACVLISSAFVGCGKQEEQNKLNKPNKKPQTTENSKKPNKASKKLTLEEVINHPALSEDVLMA